MEQEIQKSAVEIKSQILNRFDNLSNYYDSNFRDYSRVLHFEDFSDTIKIKVLEKIQLNSHELPVILSYVDEETFLFLTTEAFYYFEGQKYEKLLLSNFKWGMDISVILTPIPVILTPRGILVNLK